MCCFSRVSHPSFWSRLFAREVRVFETQIFARVEGDRQWLAYSMELKTGGDVAMILPLPVVPGSGDDALQFLNLEHYPEIFEHMANAFREPERFDPLSQGVLSAGGSNEPPLVVHSVGAFEASFVPSPKDFSRLDERFRISDSLWEKLPEYRDYGFAVFKLKRGRRQRIHPMAFRFLTRAPDKRFFPTVHIHDNLVHETARFRHVLYFQGASGDEPSREAARASVATSRAEGLVLGEEPLRRRIVNGRQPNRDVWI
jgi:hypothetical protein